MRLLRQQRQIDRIGKTGIEDGDRNGLGMDGRSLWVW